MKTEIRAADAATLTRFPAADMDGKSARAIAAVRGDEVLGVAGIYRAEAGFLAFASLSDELRADRRAIVRGVRALRALARRCRAPVYATCDERISKAADFLRHVGFVPEPSGLWRYEEAQCRR